MKNKRTDKIKNALRESEQKYRQLARDVNSIIVRIDVNGRITFLNKFAENFFGYNANRIIGKNVIGTIMPSSAGSKSDLKKMIGEVMRHPRKYFNSENENMLHGGRHVCVAWTSRAVFGMNTRPKEIICVGNDITKIKKAGKLIREIDRRKSDFVSNISSELKDPIMVIKESIGQVLDGTAGNINAHQRSRLETAEKKISSIMRLVEGLIDISGIEAGKEELKREKVGINSLVNDAIAEHKEDISGKSLRLKKDLPSDIGWFWADKDKVREVIGNLLNNAIKYTPYGGGISIKVAQFGEYIRFEISDTGPGITMKDIDKLFDKFERIKSGDMKGAGLGLAISKDIIELHKGRIGVESEPGKGSKFTFILPRDFRKR